jgi:hypothetical protein
MQAIVVPFLVLIAAPAAIAGKSEVTPIQKVIEMMDSMVAKGKAEKQAESVEFAKFHEWCDQVRSEKTKAIAEAKAAIEELAAAIDKAESDAEVLSEEIAELEADIAKNEADAKEATALRDKEHLDYAAQHRDYSESIDALARAIEVLKTRDHDVPQSLLQVSNSPLIPSKEKALITSFLTMMNNAEATAPEANAYEFQSGGIVAVMSKLKLKFEDEKLVLEKEEMRQVAAYQVLMQQLTDDIKYATASKDKKTALKAKRLEDAATAKGDKAVTEASLAKDEEILSDTNTECLQTSDDYEKNQVVRAGEIEALGKAIAIISSGAVTGNAKKYDVAQNLLQAKSGVALSQLRSGVTQDNYIRQRVVDFLQNRAKKIGSQYLALIATQAAADPFGKVKKMIKDLIVKLMEQANAEADAHAYCETELATNKQTREIKSSEVDELTAELESQNALLEKLTTEITELSEAVATLRSQQAEASAIRAEQKKTNAVTVEDAKVAQTAVEKAMTILKDYYASVAAGAALVQGATGLKQDMAQAASASLDPYKGMQAGSGGIIGMLEVILSDFARLETETQAAEDTQASEYQKFMDESNEDIAVKEAEIEHLSNNKDMCEETISELNKKLALTQEELDKALDYYDKLKKECIDTGFSYEERVKMREEEIQALQEALKVLAGEDFGF